MKKICQRALSVVLAVSLCGAPMMTLASNTTEVQDQSKISEALELKMEEISLNDASEKIPVSIWYEDIDHEAVEMAVEEETGLTVDSIDTDLSMPSSEILEDIEMLTEDTKASVENSSVEDDMKVYLAETKAARTYEQELVDTYAQAKREIAKDMVAEKAAEVIDTANISEADIIFKSKYAPMMIVSASNDEIEALSEVAVVTSLDVEEEAVVTTSAATTETENNTISAMKEINGFTTVYNKTGLTGDGVVLGMIGESVPAEAYDTTDELDMSKFQTVGTDAVAGEWGTNIATILAGTNAVSSGVEKVYCASSTDMTELTGVEFYYGIENLVDQGVHVINGEPGQTTRSNTDQNYSNLERWLDHMVNTCQLTYVQSVGEAFLEGSPILEGGLAYNTITVGGYEDNNTAATTDDYLYEKNRYDSIYGCSKPDLLAPENVADGGTDSAAAVVTSTIALMLELKPSLILHPQEIKAILLASCHRKVLDTATSTALTELMTQGLTEKQGAGVLDPFIALSIVGNGQYGERVLGQTADEIHIIQPAYDSTYMNFSVAWAQPTTAQETNYPNQTTNVPIIHDVDISVYNGGAVAIASSSESDSSTELAYFALNSTGNKYSVELSNYEPNSTDVVYGYAWSTNTMQYQTPSDAGIYFLKNKKSTRYLDVDTSGNLLQNDMSWSTTQQWILKKASVEGEYQLSNEGITGIASWGTVYDRTTAWAVLTADSTSTVRLKDNGDGTMSVLQYKPDTVVSTALQPKNSSSLSGQNVWWYQEDDSDAQKWYFERISYRRGDANTDGLVNADDLGNIQKYINNQITMTEVQEYLADVNGDGSITSDDTVKLVNIIYGIE